MRKILPLLFLSAILASCSPPDSTEVQNGTSAIVVVVGGLGGSQLKDLYSTIVLKCPKVTVIWAGDNDAYQTNVLTLINNVKKDANTKIVLIGHSFGGDTVDKAADQLESVDYLALIDPVAPGWGDMTLSSHAKSYDLFIRSDFIGPRDAVIAGAAYTVIQGGHNTIPHDPQVIDDIVNHINSL